MGITKWEILHQFPGKIRDQVIFQKYLATVCLGKFKDMLHPFCLWYCFIFLLASLSSDNDPRWRCLSCRSKRPEIFLYRFNAQKPVIRARLKPGILLIWSCYRRAIPEIFLLRQLPSFCQLYVSLWVLCQKQIRVPWCGLRRPENSPDPFIRYPLPEPMLTTKITAGFFFCAGIGRQYSRNIGSNFTGNGVTFPISFLKGFSSTQRVPLSSSSFLSCSEVLLIITFPENLFACFVA